MVAVPARPRPHHAARWLIPAIAFVGGWIGLLWLIRPTWGYCMDGIDAAHSFCDDGIFSLAAQIGTIGLILLLTAFIVLVLTVRGPRRGMVLAFSLVVLAVACVAAFALMFQQLEQIPFRIP